jgi:hypothetical protein
MAEVVRPRWPDGHLWRVHAPGPCSCTIAEPGAWSRVDTSCQRVRDNLAEALRISVRVSMEDVMRDAAKGDPD